MSLPKKPKKLKPELAGPVRYLPDAAPHRMAGGWNVEGITPYDAGHESENEKNALWLLALCHDVTEIRSQPSKEEYEDASGNLCTHIPDFLVTTTDGPLYVEIKSLSELCRPKSLDKYTSVARGYMKRGKRFALLVDAQLRQEPLFRTISILRRYVNSEMEAKKAASILGKLKHGALTALELLKDEDISLVDIFTMMAQRKICFDLSRPVFAEQLSLSLPDQPFEGLKIANILHSTRYGDLLERMAMGHRPTNQSELARAQNRRQFNQPVNPFQFFGGFTASPPIRDLGKSESHARKTWDRRSQAPGAQFIQAYKPE